MKINDLNLFRINTYENHGGVGETAGQVRAREDFRHQRGSRLGPKSKAAELGVPTWQALRSRIIRRKHESAGNFSRALGFIGFKVKCA